jgi:hypothetical protein
VSQPYQPANSPLTKHVIFSPTRGIYLGGGVWSFDETAHTRNSAPTFDHDVKIDLHATGIYNAELRMCIPDLPGGMASKDACANTGLPRW